MAHVDSQSGNRTDAGVLAQSQIMSVMQTCKQRLADLFAFIRRQLASAERIPLPLPVATR